MPLSPHRSESNPVTSNGMKETCRIFFPTKITSTASYYTLNNEKRDLRVLPLTLRNQSRCSHIGKLPFIAWKKKKEIKDLTLDIRIRECMCGHSKNIEDVESYLWLWLEETKQMNPTFTKSGARRAPIQTKELVLYLRSWKWRLKTRDSLSWDPSRKAWLA